MDLSLCLLLLFPLLLPQTAHAQTSYEERFAERVGHYFPEDVGKVAWAEATLLELLHAEIVNGYRQTDATGKTVTRVSPDAPISRAEFTALLVRALNLKAAAGGKSFTDVRQGQWFYDYVNTVSSLGIVNGTSPTAFSPNANIRRDEIAKMVALAFADTVNFAGTPKTFTDVRDYWATPYIRDVSAVGIITGSNAAGTTFSPSAYATRAEAMTMLHRALHKQTSNLPDDQTLLNAVLSNETESDNVFRSITDPTRRWTILRTIIDKYAMGQYQALSKLNIDMFEEMTNAHYTISSGHVGPDVTASVVSKSNRFAVVELKNAKYEMMIYEPEGTYQPVYHEVIDTSGFIYLHLTDGGTWKIYTSSPASFEPAT